MKDSVRKPCTPALFQTVYQDLTIPKGLPCIHMQEWTTTKSGCVDEETRVCTVQYIVSASVFDAAYLICTNEN